MVYVKRLGAAELVKREIDSADLRRHELWQSGQFLGVASFVI
jgi:hypothetical protein